jgi:CubicO group peptidase (beta-lactamase class C family)
MFAALCLGLGLLGGAEAAEKTKSAPAAPANLGEFRQRAQSLMTDAHIPGAGMVLVRDGKPVWVGGLGLADKASGRKVDADTAFRIGSISKSFLAIAILRQVERGTMHLDDKLSDIAPEIAIDNPWEATDPVRLVHVLEHTAGFDDMHFRHMRPDPAAHGTLQQMRLFAPEFHVRWRPGERMSYSNPGYGLAAYLLEKATGRRAQDVIDDEVLRPLGMTHTVWERGKAGPRLASGYSPDGTRTQAWEELSMPAVGGLISTPNDMAKYLAFYMSSGASAPGILTQHSLLRMETTGTALSARSGLAAGYGIGNVENERDGWRLRGHSGGIPGFASNFGYNRKANFGYVVMLNNMPGKVAGQLQDLMVQFVARGLPPPTKVRAIAPSEQWAGWYRVENPRNELLAGFEGLVNVGHVHVEGGHYRLGHPLGLGTGTFELLPGNLTRDEEAVGANGVFGMDAEGRRVWVDNTNVFVERGWWATAAPLYLASAALLLLMVSVVFAPVWLYRLARGRLRGAPHAGVRWWPVAAMSSLAAAVACALTLDIGTLIAAQPTAAMIGVAVFGWLFAAFGVVGLWQVLRHWRGGMHGFVRGYVLAASVAAIGLAAWLYSAGLLGVRLWAW